MKKIVSFLLAMMVLAFSMIPCADGASYAEMKAKYELSTSTQDNDQQHADACSPFCVCWCCAGFSLTARHSAPTLIITVTQPALAVHKSAKPYSIPLPVWQPPQLV